MRPTAKSTDFTKKKELWKVKMRKRRRSRFWPTRITARKVTFM